jgi:hypothetical protein
VTLSGAVLGVTTPDASYRLGSGRLSKDGQRLSSEYGRYDCDWVQAPFDADRIVVRGATGALLLGRDGSRRIDVA